MRTLRLAGYGGERDPLPSRRVPTVPTFATLHERYPGIIFAPILTRWYAGLDAIKLKSKVAVVASRVCLDQFVLTPVMIGVFFGTQSLLEGKSIDQAKRRISSSWWPTLEKNWLLFVPVQLANFSIVPPHLRLLLVVAAPKDKVKELIE
ncbi:SPOSA6832_02006 [Sporobolomyces salmonicolor]|uniref:SPOSA6832_02006-mRNA-1:cds n=1 Tax=Sporidiobolus salmonicolor TaxID=5005 RepID=A0A0D6EL90_SPOSA|nr:SPOSA6832_02006 [Sporobolomyces salmonicolor]